MAYDARVTTAILRTFVRRLFVDLRRGDRRFADGVAVVPVSTQASDPTLRLPISPRSR